MVVSIDLVAQEEQVIDSLERALVRSRMDTGRVLLLNELGWEYKFDDPDKARAYLDTSLLLARRLNFLKGIGDAYNYRGVVEDIHGNSEQAIHFFQQSRDIRNSLQDTAGVANLLNNIGNLHENLGDFAAALDNYLKSLRLREEIGDSARVVKLYYNISILYENMGEYEEALNYILDYRDAVEQNGDKNGTANAFNVIGNIKMELDLFEEAKSYYEEALQLHQELGNRWEQSTILNNLGNNRDAKAIEFAERSDTLKAIRLNQEALDFYQKALEIRREFDDQAGLAETYNNIGLSYLNQVRIYQRFGQDEKVQEANDQALDFFEQALEITEALGDKKGQIEVYIGISQVFRNRHDHLSALKYSQKSLGLAEDIGDEKFIQNAYEDLSKGHFAIGNYEQAYVFRQRYDSLLYERLNEQMIRTNAQREVLYSDRQKQYEIVRQQKEIELQEAQLKQAAITQYSLIGGTIALLLLALLLYNRYRLKTRANRELAEKNQILSQERKRSDDLLLNILPAATAEELKQHGRAKARRYESVTVLFTDFKSFTKVAEQMSPEELVAELDYCFRGFDEITTRHGIEKIKTIGDAYMCVGGLPEPNPTHPEDVVRAALEMIEFMNRHLAEKARIGKPGFETRIGIHTGPVVAGIVGNKKFAYDVWGDTVNLAARMESSGQPGKVNVSQATYELIKDRFLCTSRGKVEAKNKGDQEMYFVERTLDTTPESSGSTGQIQPQ